MEAGGASIVSRMGIIVILLKFAGAAYTDRDQMLKAPPQGVLCCGSIVLDIMVRPVERFQWGTTTWVEDIEINLGGNGANTSYTLGMLGVPVRLLGMVGRDAFGEQALSIL